jgi:hypothetical protein
MMTKLRPDDPDNQWHLDKKVPLSLIFAMLIQAGMVIWVIADIKKDVEVLKATMAAQADRDNRQDRAAYEAVALVREDLREVKALLNKLVDQQSRLHLK